MGAKHWQSGRVWSLLTSIKDNKELLAMPLNFHAFPRQTFELHRSRKLSTPEGEKTEQNLELASSGTVYTSEVDANDVLMKISSLSCTNINFAVRAAVCRPSFHHDELFAVILI